eukprot:COSAG01_NODE_7845_length_3028_cov_8.342438_1_plen_190_part_00
MLLAGVVVAAAATTPPTGRHGRSQHMLSGGHRTVSQPSAGHTQQIGPSSAAPAGRSRVRTSSPRKAHWIGHFSHGVGFTEVLTSICPICLAGVVGGRLWLTGFPLCFCGKYGKLARTDLKNERISRSGGFQACYKIIRGVGGWSESCPQPLNLSISTSEPHPLGKMSNPASPIVTASQLRNTLSWRMPT